VHSTPPKEKSPEDSGHYSTRSFFIRLCSGGRIGRIR
jgi:hypothetical protein